MMQDICEFHGELAYRCTYAGCQRWSNILPLEHRRTRPSDQDEGLASYKLYTGQFANICQQVESIK